MYKKKSLLTIAEIGMNHDGSLGNAMRLIEEAKKCGVDAVKFQLHISEAETLPNAPTPPYFKHEGRYEYFNRTAFSISEWQKLKNYSKQLKLKFIVSPFSIQAVKILQKIKVDAIKIASGEVTNLPMLEYIAKSKIPVILSSGMSSWKELDKAVDILKNNLFAILQCSSEYPCKPESVGLNIINEMEKRYPKVTVGFSDHTLDNSSSIAALVTGARIFEKHFTISKKMYGPDACFSLEPDEMKNYINGLKFIGKTLKSKVDKNNLKKYKEMKKIFEKSIVAAKNLKKGTILKLSNLDFKKPGTGILAKDYKKIIGKRINKNINKDILINITDIK